jgi:hypothetical protein
MSRDKSRDMSRAVLSSSSDRYATSASLQANNNACLFFLLIAFLKNTSLVLIIFNAVV